MKAIHNQEFFPKRSVTVTGFADASNALYTYKDISGYCESGPMRGLTSELNSTMTGVTSEVKTTMVKTSEVKRTPTLTTPPLLLLPQPAISFW